MQGDVTDISYRLRAVLPARWFAEDSPNLAAVLACLATPWSWLFGLISATKQQARIATATDQWLDLIASDFFGATLLRRATEGDRAYRARIQWAVRQQAATRLSMDVNLTHLTGSSPRIFEPSKSSDTGAYAAIIGVEAPIYCGWAYGKSGGWGNLAMPFQFFIDVRRPQILGISAVAGYGTSGGGYGAGAIVYIDLGAVPSIITDADIAATVQQSSPINAIGWLRIS